MSTYNVQPDLFEAVSTKLTDEIGDEAEEAK